MTKPITKRADELQHLDRIHLDCGDGSTLPVTVISVVPMAGIPGEVCVSYQRSPSEHAHRCSMLRDRMVTLATDGVRANSCPHCGGPYTLARPCTCVGMTAQHSMIDAAIDGDPGEENEPLVVTKTARS